MPEDRGSVRPPNRGRPQLDRAAARASASPELSLTRGLLAAAHVVRQRFSARLDAQGSSLTAYLVACALAETGPQTQRALAQRVDVSDATLGRQVDLMEQEGLVTRRRPPSDRRSILVDLTPLGELRHAQLSRTAAHLDEQLVQEVGQTVAEALRQALPLLEAALAGRHRS